VEREPRIESMVTVEISWEDHDIRRSPINFAKLIRSSANFAPGTACSVKKLTAAGWLECASRAACDCRQCRYGVGSQ
jgi:hypothetical protein